MSKVIEGIETYRQRDFETHKSHYESLKDGQYPHTLLITCSDSRVSPQEITRSKGGDLFVIRNAGNLMPPYDPENPSNEGLTLEYGVCALNVQEVVVCGHARCGAMGGLMDLDKLSALPLVQRGLQNYHSAHQSEIENISKVADLISWNVETQLKSIWSYPFVQDRLQSGGLKVSGFVYNFVNAAIDSPCILNAQGEVIRSTP